MSKLLDSFIILYFILFFMSWRARRTKARHLSSPLLGRCSDEADAGKKKQNALICSHYALWILKIMRAFPITKYRQY